MKNTNKKLMMILTALTVSFSLPALARGPGKENDRSQNHDRSSFQRDHRSSDRGGQRQYRSDRNSSDRGGYSGGNYSQGKYSRGNHPQRNYGNKYGRKKFSRHPQWKKWKRYRHGKKHHLSPRQRHYIRKRHRRHRNHHGHHNGHRHHRPVQVVVAEPAANHPEVHWEFNMNNHGEFGVNVGASL